MQDKDKKTADDGTDWGRGPPGQLSHGPVEIVLLLSVRYSLFLT